MAKRKLTKWIVFFASFISCNYSFASFDDYLAAYKQEDYKKALELLLPLVEQGDDRANNALCHMYIKGHGVKADYTKAASICRKSADNGYAKSQYVLGVLLSDHKYTKEFRALNSLPDNGALDENLIQAEIWYKKAAIQGFEGAINQICMLYARESYRNRTAFATRTHINYSEAIDWCKKSAALEPKNNWYVAELYYDSKDYKSSLEWYKKVSNDIGGNASYAIGLQYRDGLGVERDYKQAFEWFIKSAEDNSFAQYEVALAYLNGRGTTKDTLAGVEYLKQLAKKDYTDARYRLGVCYINAEGVPYDPVLGYAFIAASGVLYFNGDERQNEAKKYMAALEKRFSKDQLDEAVKIRDYLNNDRDSPAFVLPTESKTGAGVRK